MYFLLEACEHPDILRVIYFGTLILDIVTVIIPIGLIIMLLLDFTKAVIANNEDGQRKSTKLVVKRIMYAVIVFIIPWGVSVFMNILSELGIDVGTDYTVCLNNAKSGNFEYYDRLLEEEEILENERREHNWEEEINSGSSSVGTGKLYDVMADNLVSLIEGEVGNKNSDKYNANGLPWCAYFVTWAMKNTNYSKINLFYDVIERDKKVENVASAGCTMYNFNESSNLSFHYSKYYAYKYNKANYTPKKGDTIYFNWDSDWNGKITTCSKMFGVANHIGLVHHVEDGKVYTIEGNSSKQVREKSYNLTDSRIMGYGSWYK